MNLFYPSIYNKSILSINYEKLKEKKIKLRSKCNEIKPSIEKLSNEKLEKIVNYINEVINE